MISSQETHSQREHLQDQQNHKSIQGYVDWAIQRIPQIHSNELKNISYDYVLINLSSIISEHFVSSKSLLSNKSAFLEKVIKNFIDAITHLKPSKNIIVSIDGVKPIQKSKYDFVQLIKQDPNHINYSDLYPGAQLIEELHEQIKQAAHDFIQEHQELNFVILDQNMPGDALYKLRFFVRQQKNRQNFRGDFRFALVDNSNQGFLTALALHLHYIDLIQHQTQSIQQDHRNSFKYNTIDVGVFKQFVIAEFSLMNVQGVHNFQSIIDDLILLSLLLGSETLPKLTFFSFEKNGMDYLYYLYKRMYPFLNGNLSEKGVINMVNLHLFFHELGMIEDILIFNEIRQSQFQYNNSRHNNIQLQKSIEEIIEKIKQKYESLDYDPIRASEIVQQVFEKNLNETLQEQQQLKNEGEDVAQQSQPKVVPVIPSQPVQKPQVNEKKTYKSFFTPDKMKEIHLQCLSKASTIYQDCIVDTSKYGERFFEGICEDDNDEDSDIDEKATMAERNHNIGKQYLIINNYKPGERGYKDQFYLSVGKYEQSDLSLFRPNITQKYFEGIVWHFASYYGEYPAWNWEYNYHFAPFAEDMNKLSELQIKFYRQPPLTNSQYMIIMSNQSYSSKLPHELKEKIYGEQSNIADLFPLSFGQGPNKTQLLSTLEIDRFLTFLQKIPEYITFAQKIDKEEPYQILIAHKNTMQKSLTDQEANGQPQEAQQQLQHEQKNLLKIQHSNICCEIVKILNPNEDIYTAQIDTISQKLLISLNLSNLVVTLTDKEKENILEQLADIHQNVYTKNEKIRVLERSLGITVDANEVFNRGLGEKILYTLPQTFATAKSGQQSSGNNQSQMNQQQGSHNRNDNRNNHGGNHKGYQGHNNQKPKYNNYQQQGHYQGGHYNHHQGGYRGGYNQHNNNSNNNNNNNYHGNHNNHNKFNNNSNNNNNNNHYNNNKRPHPDSRFNKNNNKGRKQFQSNNYNK
ncbi:hypothetical protein ABPG72_006366 [Tetrahymena utriculariae]